MLQPKGSLMPEAGRRLNTNPRGENTAQPDKRHAGSPQARPAMISPFGCALSIAFSSIVTIISCRRMILFRPVDR
jgi:hypothetical protein